MRLAVIAGDGIGPEVVAEGLKVLGEVAPDVESTHYDLGAARWQRTGELLPDTVLDELRQHDAILLGAVGDPSVPAGILERGLLLKLRFELDHHVNLRPSKLLPGVATPLAGDPKIDFIVVREGTEGPYTGNGGTIRKGTEHEVATEVSVNTAYGVERVVRDAFARGADLHRETMAGARGRHVRPGEEGQIGPGMPFGVGVEQVVGAGVVLVDASLDQAHAEDSGIKVEVFLRRTGNRGDVVKAVDGGHGVLS